MTKRATSFIGLTITSGTVLLLSCLLGHSPVAQSTMYLCCCALALFGSALKVRLPGITGTISVNFLFVLIATAAFTFSETVLLASMASLVQCLWRARRRPRALQVAFNVATLAISAACTYRAAHFVAGVGESHLAVLMAIAAALYFTTNTLLICGVLSLVERKPLSQVWQQCHLWAFPYYFIGAAIAAAVVVCSHTLGWKLSMMILPLMYLVYVFYRLCVARITEAREHSQRTLPV